MEHIKFAQRATSILEKDENIIGLAVAGSWIENELDEYSDLDLIIVSKQKIAGNFDLMQAYAKSIGNFLSGFTGEHVGEPRVLICLYDTPLLHVDIKFLTLEEFHSRIETPVLLFDRDQLLQNVLLHSTPHYPMPDYQWIENRFWTWIHYALLKIGRGESLEAFDFLAFLRMIVFGPLLQIRNGKLPRGVRKVERDLKHEDLVLLQQTIPNNDKKSLLNSLTNAVSLYRELRTSLYGSNVLLQKETETSVMDYFEKIIRQ